MNKLRICVASATGWAGSALSREINEERRKLLEKNIRQFCTGTDSRLAELKEKYRENSAVIERLSLYAEDIEPGN